jgi:hypothetical protein
LGSKFYYIGFGFQLSLLLLVKLSESFFSLPLLPQPWPYLHESAPSPPFSIVMPYIVPQWLYVPDLFDLIITVSSDFWDSQGTEDLFWFLASYVNVQSCQLDGLNNFLNVVGLRNQNQYILSWEESLISYVVFCKCKFANCIFFFR